MLDHYIELEYASRSYDAATLVIPPRAGWVTIPFDTEIHDPDGMHHQPGGWSILTAPAECGIYYSLNGFLRLMGGQPGCSTHLMPYWARALEPGEVDGEDNVIERREACEVFVGDHETHTTSAGTTWFSNTHLLVPFQGILPPGARLRLCADYWNAPSGAPALKVVGATVTGFWGYV